MASTSTCFASHGVLGEADHTSIFLGQQDGGHGAIPFGDDPDASAVPQLVGREHSPALAHGPQVGEAQLESATSDLWVRNPMAVVTQRFYLIAEMASNPAHWVMSLFQSRLEPTRHKQRLVNSRSLRRRLWVSLALVGSNFLGNSWVQSGWSFVAPTRLAAERGTAVVLLFSLLASGQIRLRRIDGWQKIATVLRQQTPRAADDLRCRSR
jgi:hypothetical protein